MKFIISRTSIWGGSPHPQAVQEQYTRVDERPVDDPSKLKFEYLRKSWPTEGTNHRVVNGHICRDFPDLCWVINFETLDDLLEFIKENGQCIISPASAHEPALFSLEIYDDCRE